MIHKEMSNKVTSYCYNNNASNSAPNAGDSAGCCLECKK